MSETLYLLSSLETLQRDSIVHADTFDVFISLCERHLEKEQYDFVHSVFLGTYQGNDELAYEWNSFYLMYKNFKADHRQVPFDLKDQPSLLYVNDGMPVSSPAMRMCVELENSAHPLEWEEIFVKHAWALLTDLDSRYYYAIENVIIYGLKLRLAMRMSSFTKEKGNQNWKHITSAIAKKSGFTMESFNTNEEHYE